MSIEISFEKIVKSVAILNAAVIIFIYADYFIPVGSTITSKVEKTNLDIISVVVKSGRSHSSTTKGSRQYQLILKNADTIKFVIEPSFYYNIKENEPVEIYYTPFLNRAKTFTFPESNIEENTSFIAERTIFILLMGVLLVSILKFLYSKLPEFLIGCGFIIQLYVLYIYFQCIK